MRQPRARAIDYSRLKYILYGASPIPLDLLRECMEVFGCGFCQQYGMTQTAIAIACLPPEDHDPAGNPRMRDKILRRGLRDPYWKGRAESELAAALGPSLTSGADVALCFKSALDVSVCSRSSVMADSAETLTAAKPSGLDFDPVALRAKYRAERDKRLRADGNAQYQNVTGGFAHFLDDPHVAPGFQRAPLTDEIDVVMIGGGFGGLLAAARLREAGVKDLRVIEKGGDFGGTWYWNRYPGAACDVESYIYLPLLEELNYIPVEKYTRAPEILFCKRPCIHDDYLATFNRPSVYLIDTEGRGVERITETGVVANGVEYPIDCLIDATGFEVGTGYSRRAGYEVVGRDGQTLTQKWADGVSTLHGFLSHGFPNCFIMSNTQSGFTVNFPHIMNDQAKRIAYIVEHCLGAQMNTVEPSEAAEADWVQTIVDSAIQRQKFAEECTPGYYNNEGQPSRLAARNGPYGKGAIAFAKLLEDWRAEGGLQGLERRSA